MEIVGVGLVQRLIAADGGAAQAIADLAGFQQAGLLVAVGARPAGISGIAALVDKLQEIAGRVILILLDVGTNGVAVAGTEQIDAGDIIVRGRRRRQGLAAVQAQLLAPAGLDDAVDSVIGVVAAGLNSPILEEDYILDVSVVLNVGDVAYGVIGVGQFLHGLLICGKTGTRRGEVGEAEGQRVVAVSASCIVAIRQKNPLASSVVINVADEGCPHGGTAHVYRDRFEQICFIVGRRDYAAIGFGGCHRAVKRIVGGKTDKNIGQERWCGL